VTLPANVAGGTSTTYNADNEQTAFNGTTFSFDANGNLTGDGVYTYIYGARNQLNQIKQGSTVVATIGYDAFGRRKAKVTATTTQYLYDGLNPVQELTGANPPGVTANLLTGLRIDEYFSRTDSSGNVSSFLRDALGSTVGLVGSAQSIATSYTYQPFGATTVSGTSNGNICQFTGRETDATGSYFYRARYYSPSFQNFVAQDPMNLHGGDTNQYAYVHNNPTKCRDLLGRQAEGGGGDETECCAAGVCGNLDNQMQGLQDAMTAYLNLYPNWDPLAPAPAEPPLSPLGSPVSLRTLFPTAYSPVIVHSLLLAAFNSCPCGP
jgi:RHS repeat-associated protein